MNGRVNFSYSCVERDKFMKLKQTLIWMSDSHILIIQYVYSTIGYTGMANINICKQTLITDIYNKKHKFMLKSKVVWIKI